jgi:hypothetical protein
MLNGSFYDPRAFQQAIADGAKKENLVGLNQFVEPPWSNEVGPKGAKYGDIDALPPVDKGLNYNLCSKSCCSQQWPVPFDLKPDPLVEKGAKDFVPSSYMCNNAWQDSGCLCMTKDQSQFLANRGQSNNQ